MTDDRLRQQQRQNELRAFLDYERRLSDGVLSEQSAFLSVDVAVSELHAGVYGIQKITNGIPVSTLSSQRTDHRADDALKLASRHAAVLTQHSSHRAVDRVTTL